MKREPISLITVTAHLPHLHSISQYFPTFPYPYPAFRHYLALKNKNSPYKTMVRKPQREKSLG
jgi:hypothetical protein